MKRRLHFVLTGLSLLLFVAIGALWIRSIRISDFVAREDSAGEVFGLQTHRGGVEFSRHPSTFAIWQGTTWAPGKGRWSMSSFRWGEPFGSPITTSITFPSGATAMTLTIAPASNTPGMTLSANVSPVGPPRTSVSSPPATFFAPKVAAPHVASFTFGGASPMSNPMPSPRVITTVPVPSGQTLVLTGTGSATYSGQTRLNIVSSASGKASGGGKLIALPSPNYLTLTLTGMAWSPPEHHFLGFGFESIPTLPRTFTVAPTFRAAVPFWFLMLAASLLPARSATGWMRTRRRIRRRRCVGCGYDLRATPGKCPECGLKNAANARNSND